MVSISLNLNKILSSLKNITVYPFSVTAVNFFLLSYNCGSFVYKCTLHLAGFTEWKFLLKNFIFWNFFLSVCYF